jgi:hypothetical protein
MDPDGLADFIAGHKHSIDKINGAQIIRQLNGSRLNFCLVDRIGFRICNLI